MLRVIAPYENTQLILTRTSPIYITQRKLPALGVVTYCKASYERESPGLRGGSCKVTPKLV